MDSVKEEASPEYRDRLRTWLVKMINSGTIPGLAWENQENTIFRMPWKHAGRQDYNLEEDSKIFMAWAKHSGRYRAGIDKPEPIVWKTRLRCALNKMPDIRELPDRSRLDVSEPYRVYQLLPPVHKASQIRRRINIKSTSSSQKSPVDQYFANRSISVDSERHHSGGSYHGNQHATPPFRAPTATELPFFFGDEGSRHASSAAHFSKLSREVMGRNQINPAGAFSKPVSLPAGNPWFGTAHPSLASLHHNFMKMDLLSSLKSCGALMHSPFSQSFPLVPGLAHPSLGPMFQGSYRQEESKAPPRRSYSSSFAIRSLLGENGVDCDAKKGAEPNANKEPDKIDKQLIEIEKLRKNEKALVEKCRRLERKLFSVESQLHETKGAIERVSHENKALIGDNGVLVGSDLLVYACNREEGFRCREGQVGECQRGEEVGKPNVELKPSTSQPKSSQVNSFSFYQHKSCSETALDERSRKRSRINTSNQSFKHCRLSEDQSSTETGATGSRENSDNRESLSRSPTNSIPGLFIASDANHSRLQVT